MNQVCTYQKLVNCVSVRAYIPFTTIRDMPMRVNDFTSKVCQAVAGLRIHHDDVLVAANRAGLHLSYAIPAKTTLEPFGILEEIKRIETQLRAAGWKETKTAT